MTDHHLGARERGGKPERWIDGHYYPADGDVEHCHANRDGECTHPNCPQLRDGEPAKSRRNCPFPDWEEEE